ncbi:F-box domain-containing protein [Mycena sanguinolenta]|uniref:F-box domain-containing protein n=1 Tax=Mycena sanguinolenta TaxID=230812 RepID=A0A8H6ZAP8_9AGAR|nr:F-box domain-containing protein [Mycena sanguinolenta]
MEVPESSSIDDLDAKACSLQLDDPLHQPPPFLSLPPEIVAEIFVNFFPIYPTFPSHSGKLSPLLLCQVCRHWRDIALSTPALWKNISIDVQDPDDHQDEKLERFKTRTARSGNCPLSLKLTGPTTSSVLTQFIETIVAHCSRWEHLEVLVPFDSLHLLKGDMPLLRDLTFGPIDLRHDVHSALSLFQHAPALHQITLTSCFLNATVLLPWAQLTHLDAHCLYEDECTDILCAAPLLVTCTLSVCCSDDDIVIGPAVPVHTILASVSLLAEDPDVRLWLVLDCLTLPALRLLQVAEPCISLGGLAAFVARSGCALDELTITDATLEEEAGREVLPSVGEISMDRKITLQSWDR